MELKNNPNLLKCNKSCVSTFTEKMLYVSNKLTANNNTNAIIAINVIEDFFWRMMPLNIITTPIIAENIIAFITF